MDPDKKTKKKTSVKDDDGLLVIPHSLPKSLIIEDDKDDDIKAEEKSKTDTEKLTDANNLAEQAKPDKRNETDTTLNEEIQEQDKKYVELTNREKAKVPILKDEEVKEEVKDIEEAYKEKFEGESNNSDTYNETNRIDPEQNNEKEEAVALSHFATDHTSHHHIDIDYNQAPITTVTEDNTPKTKVYTDEDQEKLVVKEEWLDKRKKEITKIFIALSSVVFVLVAVLLWYSLIYNRVTYKTFSLQNSGYNYTFTFYSDAVNGNRGTYNQLAGHLRDPVIALTSVSPLFLDCNSILGNSTVIFHYTHQNISYPVCIDNTKSSILATFKDNGVWQQVAMYSINSNSKVSIPTAIKLLDSLTITKQKY